MSNIKDQRTMNGAQLHDTPESVREFWIEAIARGGAPERDYSRELQDTDDSIKPYINEGRWVADCPRCNGGIATWSENPRACCLDCGTTFVVEFPVEDVPEAEAILESRPTKNKNWKPDSETLDDLKADNLLHGFPIPEVS